MDTSPFDFLVFIIFIIIYLSVFLLFIFRVAFHFVFIIKLPCVFLLFSVFPDTFLLFPLVALSMCYSVVPRYDPYNVFLFVIIVATGVNLLVNNFVTTNLYLFSCTIYDQKHEKI